MGCRVSGFGLRDSGQGFQVSGFKFRVWGLEFEVLSLRFKVWDLGCGVWGLGWSFGVWVLESRFWGVPGPLGPAHPSRKPESRFRFDHRCVK